MVLIEFENNAVHEVKAGIELAMSKNIKLSPCMKIDVKFYMLINKLLRKFITFLNCSKRTTKSRILIPLTKNIVYLADSVNKEKYSN